MAAEPFLSASWYRAAHLRPRLCDHAEVRRHCYRGRVWYVVEDRLTGRVHRLTVGGYRLVAGMDGKRSVDEVWGAAAAHLGEEAPSQDDFLHLLMQLHAADLLRADLPPDARELFERSARQRRSRMRQVLLNPISLRLPLWDPDAFLEYTLPLVRPLFGQLGGLLWLALVAPALILAAAHWPELSDDLGDRLLAVDNLWIIALSYPVIKLLHELGHAYATKTYGGQVRELGVIFLVLFPVPYVDASAAAAFRSKRRRAVVGAAGMLVETALAALALYAWLLIQPGAFRALAFNVMVIGGVSTVVFNGNPLLRFDGYFVLADLLEIPNLTVRSTRYWAHLVDRYLFRTEGTRAFAATPGERAWFLAYAPAAFAYRVAVLLAIALFLAARYQTIGVALALWTVATAVVVPAARALHHVATSPRLQRNRRWALGSAGTLLAVASGFLLLVPLPSHTTTEGVVWLPDSAIVRAGGDGFVRGLLVAPGTRVGSGDPLIESAEPTLAAERAVLRGQVRTIEAKLAGVRFSDRVQAEISRSELGEAEQELARADQRVDQLIARSPANGVLAVAQSDDLPGRFVREGDILGYVLPDGARIVRATVSQDDIDLVRGRLRGVSVKLAGRPADTWPARVVREIPAGRRDLPSKALGSGGGGALPVDPRDQRGIQSLERRFQLDLQLSVDAPMPPFGSRVHVRFDLAPEPLADQLYRRVRQLFLARLQA